MAAAALLAEPGWVFAASTRGIGREPRTAEDSPALPGGELKHGRDTNEAGEFREGTFQFLRLDRRYAAGLLVDETPEECESGICLLFPEIRSWLLGGVRRRGRGRGVRLLRPKRALHKRCSTSRNEGVRPCITRTTANEKPRSR